MSPRHGVLAGAAMAVLVAAVLAAVPVAWLADMLAVSGPDATTFLLRRYAASATAGLAVTAFAVTRQAGSGADGLRAGLLGLGTWFGVQAVTAWWGVASGTVGGLAWAAVVADPLLAAWLLTLYRRPDPRPRRLSPRPGRPGVR